VIKTECDPNIPQSRTPVTGRTLKDKLKSVLAKNCKASTPQSNKQQQIREATVQLAIKEAEEMSEECHKYDLGPFFGLPSKVQQLFVTHKGIKKLYGKYCVFSFGFEKQFYVKYCLASLYQCISLIHQKCMYPVWYILCIY